MYQNRKKIILVLLFSGVVILSLVLKFAPVICCSYYSNDDQTIWKKKECLFWVFTLSEEYTMISDDTRVALQEDHHALKHIEWKPRGGYRKNIFGTTVTQKSI